MNNDNKYSRYYTHIKPVINHPFVRSSAPYIFSLITIAVFAVFVIRPTISTILQLQKKIEENQKTLEALTDKARKLSEAKNNLDNMSPEIKDKIQAAIPERAEVISLINNLQSTASRSASISALQIQPVTLIDFAKDQQPKTGLGEVEFSLNTQGAYAILLDAIYKSGITPRIFSLNNITLNKQTDEPIVMSVTGKAYYIK